MKDFAALLADLDQLSGEADIVAKSIPAASTDLDNGDDVTDPNIDPKALAKPADPDAPKGAVDPAKPVVDPENPDAPAAVDPDAPPVAKSLPAAAATAEEEVVDATEFFKSMLGRIDTTDENLTKALTATLDLVGKQNEMIKSLSDRIEVISGQGRGRRTVINVAELPTPAGQQPQQQQPEKLSGNAIMAKALTAQMNGTLTAMEVSRCEIALQSGFGAPADVLAKLN